MPVTSSIECGQELTTKEIYKSKIILSHCRICSTLRKQYMVLTKKLEQPLDGTYTQMLRNALNVSWKQHMTNEELYKNLQNVGKKIAERRLRRAGHCLRHPEEITSHLFLWQPTIGSTSRGEKQQLSSTL